MDVLALWVFRVACTVSLQLEFVGSARTVISTLDLVETDAVQRRDSIGSSKDAHIAERVEECARPNWTDYGKKAKDLWEIYGKGFEFPAWSIDMLAKGELSDVAALAEIYYDAEEDFEDVKKVAVEREPVNIAMRRYYNKEQLKKKFGYEIGGYAGSTQTKLMPNIAVYVKTPMTSGKATPRWNFGSLGRRLFGRRGVNEGKTYVHVINSIAYAFDSNEQPDHQYFFPLDDKKWEELVQRMSMMWTFIFTCAKRKGLKRIFLAGVGGGAFSLLLQPPYDYKRLKQESLGPVRAQFGDIEVQPLPYIPDFIFGDGKDLVNDSLFVNAWDPWSMVGNGNANDNSLDGFFGRCSAMAVLAWPITNPCAHFSKVTASLPQLDRAEESDDVEG